jgi:lauroyl/myristoyl acyltransferase
VQVWPDAQLTTGGLRCQHNKVSRELAGVVPVPGWQGADRKAAMAGLKDRLTGAGYGLGWSVVCRLPEPLAERLKPESLYHRFVAFREGLGMEVLPASGGAQRFGILAQRLRADQPIGLVCDRDLTGTGIEVEFFGETARMMGGAAALAVQTGAALMPVILWFEGDHRGVHVHQEIPVPAGGDRMQKAAAMMQEVACLFEAGIRAHPQDWHMLQHVFAADLDPGRLRRTAGS